MRGFRRAYFYYLLYKFYTMSVRTTADELRDEAREHINKAYKCLDQILDPDADTWGANDFAKAYLITLEDIAVRLRKMRREL